MGGKRALKVLKPGCESMPLTSHRFSVVPCALFIDKIVSKGDWPGALSSICKVITAGFGQMACSHALLHAYCTRLAPINAL